MTAGVGADRPHNVERVSREVYGQAVATLVRAYGDITLAEDAVQDAFVVATDTWTDDGIPPNPAAWIITTARNRAIDGLRRANRGQELHQLAALPTQSAGEVELENETLIFDDRLRLIFTCCHPSLRGEHQVALTLRLLGGLSVAEVARSFLVGETAMAKRLVRAKYKIKAANIPYRVPAGAELTARLTSVLTVIYLIYNTGLDDPRRESLRVEAVRLARLLVALMPDEPEVAGLLALILLSDSRVPSRRTVEGELVLLQDQDRSLWDQDLIEEGAAIVQDCVRRNRPGPFQLQAAIQAAHCQATSFDQTDWEQIVILYDRLWAVLPTAVVALNRAIAIGERDGPESAIVALDRIAPGLDGYHLLHAARGTTLLSMGHSDEAREAYQRAAELAVSEADRRFLEERLRDLTAKD